MKSVNADDQASAAYMQKECFQSPKLTAQIPDSIHRGAGLATRSLVVMA
jgi:hypothetical protein